MMVDIKDVIGKELFEKIGSKKKSDFFKMSVEDLMACHALVTCFAHPDLGDDRISFVTDNKYILSLKEGIEANSKITIMTKQEMVKNVLNDMIPDPEFC